MSVCETQVSPVGVCRATAPAASASHPLCASNCFGIASYLNMDIPFLPSASKSLETYRFGVEGCLDLVNQRRSLEGGFPPLGSAWHHLSQGDLSYSSMKVVFEMPFTFPKSINETVNL